MYKALFKIKTQEIPSHLSAHVVVRTVQLLTHEAYCRTKLSYYG